MIGTLFPHSYTKYRHSIKIKQMLKQNNLVYFDNNLNLISFDVFAFKTKVLFIL